MISSGYVYEIKNSTAFVKCSRPKSCEHCENSSICNKKEFEIAAFNPVGAQVGDYVEIETKSDRKSIYIMAYIFLVPVAMIFLLYYLFCLNAWLTLCAVPLGAAYFIILKKIEKNFEPEVEIIRILPPENLPEDGKNKG